MSTKTPIDPATAKRLAIEIIIVFGIVSLAGDAVYEGARSVQGPYLATLGANAAIVGLIAGIGEFIGYALRLLSGVWSDRTKSYWFFTILGYALLISVPLLGLAGGWQLAAVFMLFERLGKALRAPAKSTILSTAAKHVGTGFGFGLHEAMDQIGAILGPLVFVGILTLAGLKGVQTADAYRQGYLWLLVPFALVILSVLYAFIRVPDPEKLEEIVVKKVEGDTLTGVYWLYIAFAAVAAFGFVNWAVLGFHFKKTGVISDPEIPLFYAIAMGVDAIVAIVIGLLYDRFKKKSDTHSGGLVTLVVIPLASALIPIFGFARSRGMAIASAVTWGVVMGAHETIMKSAIADITPLHKRGTGYGIFNTVYGLAMLASAALMGVLYETASVVPIIVVSLAAEAIALALFFVLRARAVKPSPEATGR